MKKVMKRALSLMLAMMTVMSMTVFIPLVEIASNATDAKVENAISWAIAIANDDTHGYSRSNRTGPDYDCSSFVSTAFKQAGFAVSGSLTTSTMASAFTKVGFVLYSKGSVAIERGDILLKPGTHVELYLGNSQCVAAHSDNDGISGDSDGKEIDVRTKNYCTFCKNAEYTYVLRYQEVSYTYTSIPDGTYYLKNKATGGYLTVEGVTDANGQNVHTCGLLEESYQSAQRMIITSESNGYKLRPELCSDRVINGHSDTITSGVNVSIWNNTNDSSQRWLFESVDGGYIIHNAQNTSCVLDVNGSANALVATRHGGDSQIWELIRQNVSGSCGDNLTWNLDNITGVLTISGTGDMYDYSAVNGGPSVEYGAPWVAYRDSIKAVVIEEGVTSIGDFAFFVCSNITSCLLPSTLTDIGNWSIASCSGLIDIALPDSVETIGYASFGGCTSLKSIDLGEGLKAIGEWAFNTCEIESIIIPSGVTTIDEATFYGCGSLAKIVIPQTVETIADSAFDNCENVTIYGMADSCAQTYAEVKSIDFIAIDSCEYLGHDYETEWTVDVEPTETSVGSKSRHCANCTAKTDVTEIPKLTHTHSFGAWTTTKAATCSASGTEQRSCACGYAEQRMLEMLAHDYESEWTVDVEPTETAVGFKSRHCKNCTAKTDVTEIPIIDPALPFTDVSKGDWYYDSVEFAVDNGLFNGVTANEFAPNMAMTRAMLVTVLYRMDDSPSVSGVTERFADVKQGQYYYDAVLWAANNRIVNGVGENRFAPDDKVTREQMAAILYRFSLAREWDVSAVANLAKYPDAGKISSYAMDALSWANAEGLIGGTDVGGIAHLDPKGKATRAQVATILMRFKQNVA